MPEQPTILFPPRPAEDAVRDAGEILSGALRYVADTADEKLLATDVLEKAKEEIETHWRDPVKSLQTALHYICATRGERQARKSDAWEILDFCRESLVNGCIDELIGERRKTMGGCPCRRHPEWLKNLGAPPPLPQAELPPPDANEELLNHRPPPRPRHLSGKDRAAGEREDE